MNYYELFEIPVQFNISLDDLNQKYTKMQIRYHPDNATNSDEMSLFTQKYADLVQGYKVLSNNISRGRYFFKLKEVEINQIQIPSDILEKYISIFEECIENEALCAESIENLNKEMSNLHNRIINDINSDINKSAYNFLLLIYIDSVINNIKSIQES